MKPLTRLLTALGFALCSLPSIACAVPVRAGEVRDEGRIHVVVLHTNDVHGQVLPRKATWLKRDPAPMVGGLPRVAAYVNSVKRAAEQNGEIVFVVDAGDWFQGTPEGLLDDGLTFVRALGLVGYDALCVGNHDFDHGIPNLVSILKDTKIPAIAANLDDKKTSKPVEWVAPWRIVERGGIRIAFVGLVTPLTPEISHPDTRTLDFVEPSKAFARAHGQLAGKADWIVPVTHLGVDADKQLAKAWPELALIVGGHSHTFLKEGAREGSTLIVQSGSKVSSVGRVDVWFDKATKKVVESKSKLIDLEAEPDPKFASHALDDLCASLVARTEVRMKEVVGELTAPAERSKDPLASSTLGNLLSDAVRAQGRADVGLMNRGGIRADMQKGPITRRDVFEVMPFDNNIVVLKMTGQELEGMVRNAIEGKAHSGIEVSGISIEVIVGANDARTLTGLRIGGEKIETARVYRVAMNSFMADGGDAYIERAQPGEKRTDDVMLLREMLENMFVNKGRVTPPTDNRYVVTKP